MAQSPILGITQVAPNQNNKETTINDGFSAIERSLNDRLEVSLSAGNAVLTPEDFRRHGLFFCSGHSAVRTLTIPKQKRIFAVQNGGTGSAAVTVLMEGQTSAGRVVVNPGSYVIMYADGTSKIEKIADSASASLAPAFIGLVDTPKSYTDTAGMFLRVRSTGDGIEFDRLTFSDLADVASYAAAQGQYPRVKSDGTGIEFVSANPGGETEFVRLNDVPNTYDGFADGFVKVKPDGTGLAFVKRDAAFSIRDLTDVPDSFSGMRGKLLAVDANSRSIEFIDAPDATAKRTVLIPFRDPGFNEAMGSNGWANTLAPIAAHQNLLSFGAITGPTEGALFYLFEGSEGTTAGRVAQSVSLLDTVAQAEIDGGATFTLSGRFGTFGTTPGAKITIDALSATQAVLSTQSTETLRSPSAWGQFQLVLPLPVSTTGVRITIDSLAVAPATPGEVVAVAYDNFVTSLEVVEDLTFKNLNDTPDSYEGAAGKLVRVKPDASGLEFYTLALSLLNLTDGPQSYAGAAGSLLIVNEGENGIELRDLAEAVTIENIGGSPGPLDGRAGFYLRVREDELGLEYVEFTEGGGGSGGATRLSQLLDVSVVPAPTQGQALAWDETTRRWRPTTIAASGGGSGDGGFADVPSDGKTYARRDKKWVLLPDGDTGTEELVVFKEVVNLVNGGAESASMAGWAVAPANSMVVKTVPAGTITAAYRGALIFGAAAVPLASMSQDVDMTRYAEMIEKGIASFTFAAHHAAGYSIPEASILRIDALDRSGSSIGGSQTGDISPADGVWSAISLSMQLPVGTATLRLTATSKRLAGSNNDNYFDAFEGQFSAVFGIVDAPKDGKSYVRKDNAWTEAAIAATLDDLTNVEVKAPTNGQALVYDSTAKQWVAGSVSGGIADAPADGVIYARKDGKWVLAPAGGDGSRGSFRGPASSGFTGTYSFETGTISSDLVFDRTGASIVTRENIGGSPSTTKALRFPVTPNAETTTLSIALDMAAAGPVLIRASSDSENVIFDYLSFLVDGVEVDTANRIGGVNTPARTITLNVGAGKHTIGIRYQKDSSGSAGLDTGFIHSIEIPGFEAPQYAYGDMVTYQGLYWFCLAASTKDVPASGTGQWAKIPPEFPLPPLDGKPYMMQNGVWVEAPEIEPDPGLSKTIRLYFTRSVANDASTYISLAEVEFLDGSGVKLPVPVASVKVSSEFDAGNRPKAGLIDGNRATFWTTEGGQFESLHWAEFTFAEPVAPAQVKLVAREGRIEQFPSAGYVTAIVDGIEVEIATWDTPSGLQEPGATYPLGIIPDGAAISDAPRDGILYGRKDGAWAQSPAAGIPDAPIDGQAYLRKDGSWAVFTGGGSDDGGSGQATAFKHYRLIVDGSPSGSYIGFSEVVFGEHGAGTAFSKTAYDSGYAAALAFDGNAATWWCSANAAVGEFIGFSFTTPKAITSLTLTNAPSRPQYGPPAFTVEGSNSADPFAAVWTTIKAFSGIVYSDANPTQSFPLPTIDDGSGGKASLEEAPTDGALYGRGNGAWSPVVEEAPKDTVARVRQGGEWVALKDAIGDDGGTSIPTAGRHKHWRIRALSSVHTSYVAITEVVFRAFIGGAQIAVGGMAFSSPTYSSSSHLAAEAFDGNLTGSNYWESVSGTVTSGVHWVGYEFTDAVFISEVVLYSSTAESDESILDFVVEYSDDKTVWTEAHRATTGFVNDSSKVQVFGTRLPGAISEGDTAEPVVSAEFSRMIYLSQVAYDALAVKDSRVLYLVP